MFNQPVTYSNLIPLSWLLDGQKASYADQAGIKYAQAAYVYEMTMKNYDQAATYTILAAQQYASAGLWHTNQANKVHSYSNAGIYYAKTATLYQSLKNSSLAGQYFTLAGNNYNLAALSEITACEQKKLYTNAYDQFISASKQYTSILDIVLKTAALASATLAQTTAKMISC